MSFNLVVGWTKNSSHGTSFAASVSAGHIVLHNTMERTKTESIKVCPSLVLLLLSWLSLPLLHCHNTNSCHQSSSSTTFVAAAAAATAASSAHGLLLVPNLLDSYLYFKS